MIGEMRNKITVQTLSGGTDSGGGQATSYGSDVTVWAKVENLSGTQRVLLATKYKNEQTIDSLSDFYQP